jgi:hypothetical protein
VEEGAESELSQLLGARRKPGDGKLKVLSERLGDY